jgi:hypothetical protein
VSKLGVLVVSLIALGLIRGPASAQVLLPGLPDVQSVNASAELGTIWPTPFSTVPRTSVNNVDLWGWGVETEFQIPVEKGTPWEATLAVGYNQLNLAADIYKGRRLRGTLRDLPALSLYFGRVRHVWYIGVTIAESDLINGRLIRAPDPGMIDPGPIKVTAGAFSAGISLGWESGPLFLELGYMGRYFPSLQYDGIPTMTGFPPDLGQRMYAGGFMLRVGGRLDLKKPELPKS